MNESEQGRTTAPLPGLDGLPLERKVALLSGRKYHARSLVTGSWERLLERHGLTGGARA